MLAQRADARALGTRGCPRDRVAEAVAKLDSVEERRVGGRELAGRLRQIAPDARTLVVRQDRNVVIVDAKEMRTEGKFVVNLHVKALLTGLARAQRVGGNT